MEKLERTLSCVEDDHCVSQHSEVDRSLELTGTSAFSSEIPDQRSAVYVDYENLAPQAVKDVGTVTGYLNTSRVFPWVPARIYRIAQAPYLPKTNAVCCPHWFGRVVHHDRRSHRVNRTKPVVAGL
jgi:hypothetical protein